MTKPESVPKPAVQPQVATAQPPPDKRMSFWVWVATAALALILLTLIWWQPFTTKPTSVVVEIVTPGPITRVLAVNGQVSALKSVSKHSSVSGTLLNLWVAEGDLVKLGDILVQIDAAQQAAVLRQAVAALDAGLVARAAAKTTLAPTQALGNNLARVRTGWSQVLRGSSSKNPAMNAQVSCRRQCGFSDSIAIRSSPK
jgi:multidrug efflux pump subunit AcrA (membrane-fusion protein)